MKTDLKHSLITAIAIIGLSVFTGCTGGGGGGGSDSDSESSTSSENLTTYVGTTPTGTALACDRDEGVSVLAADYEQVAGLDVNLPIQRINISKDEAESSELHPNAQNTVKRMSAVIKSTEANGTVSDELVHPIIVSYAEQVFGPYEMGDGSADIGDPNTIDDIFVSLSLDNGKTWKKTNVSNTADKSSIDVNWHDGTEGGEKDTPYRGHSHKPKMAVHGNNILVAWHDKFCPSGNPLDLNATDDNGNVIEDLTLHDGNITYLDDYYKVNGAQGSINYGLDGTLDPETQELALAPNGKEVYEVPFSCVWTARGIMNTDDEDNVTVTWHKAEQLTSGSRDANKVWIAAADVGFAITWQEDPEGLRQGKGAGPGEGWSGATTNHGADIWYSYLPMDDFDDVDPEFVPEGDDLTEEELTKPKSLYNFSYPVRITDNEVCIEGDTKPYCADVCTGEYITTKDEGEDGENVTKSAKCLTSTVDPLSLIYEEQYAVILDGDTGASRPAMSILKTNAEEDEYQVILAYEETKGLSDSHQTDEDKTLVDIELEGKVVYFINFPFADTKSVEVSPGSIVNPPALEEDTGDTIFENARRAVIVNQVDSCDAGTYTFGVMYKQGTDVRGGSSDMFVRMNTGFTADTFVKADKSDGYIGVPNLSSMPDFNKTLTPDAMPEDSWTPANLEDATYINTYENTFSPRGFMRGEDIFIGFEYTPNWAQTEKGNEPNTFYIHRYVEEDGVREWKGPKQISKVVGRKVSTLDPRFFPTPKGSITDIPSDLSNPNILFLAYGTFDMESGYELDLFYTYSTDYGKTWKHVDRNTTDEDGNTVLKEADPKITSIDGIEEKEVQLLITPDGTSIYTVWIQEQERHEDGITPVNGVPTDEDGNAAEHFGGLESWSARVDFNTTTEQ